MHSQANKSLKTIKPNETLERLESRAPLDCKAAQDDADAPGDRWGGSHGSCCTASAMCGQSGMLAAVESELSWKRRSRQQHEH